MKVRQPRNVIVGAVFAALLLVLAGCDDDDDRRVCLPPAVGQELKAAGSVTSASDKPSHYVLIVDRSQGMAGFVRRAGGPASMPSEYSMLLSALGSGADGIDVAHETYVMPDESKLKASDRPKLESASLNELLQLQDCRPDPKSDAKEDLKHCPGYKDNSYISPLLMRAQGEGYIDKFMLSAGSADVMLLVTDLQPDIPPNQDQAVSRMSWIQDSFAKLLKSSMAIGIVPVIGHFRGTLYDFGGPKQTAVLTDPKSRQPFFLIAIGPDRYVQWMVTKLTKLRDAHLRNSVTPTKDLKPALFTGRTPDISNDSFSLLSPPDKVAEAPPAKDDFYKITPVITVEPRQDVALIFKAALLASSTSVLRYHVRVADETLVAPRVWQYHDTPYSAPACEDRWRDVSGKSIFRADLQPASAADAEDAVQLTAAKEARRMVGATYYVDEPIHVLPSLAENQVPASAAAWSYAGGPAGPVKDQMADPLIKESSTTVSVGVNALKDLFGALEDVTPQQSPVLVHLRFAMRVEER